MKKSAFSLVELLVSVMVISIIAVAFAPIVTKKISANLPIIGNKTTSQQEQEEQPEPGSAIFTTSTSGCTSKSDSYGKYVECSFTIPDKVKEINIVSVGSGSGGAGGVKGMSGTVNKEFGAVNGETKTLDIDSSMEIETVVVIGGGGGGAPAGLIQSGNAAGGGGGASGAHMFLHSTTLGSSFDFASTYTEPGTTTTGYLTRALLRPGTGGQPGQAGNNTEVILYYTNADKSETLYTKHFGAQGGLAGQKPDISGTTGGEGGGKSIIDARGQIGIAMTVANPGRYVFVKVFDYGWSYSEYRAGSDGNVATMVGGSVVLGAGGAGGKEGGSRCSSTSSIVSSGGGGKGGDANLSTNSLGAGEAGQAGCAHIHYKQDVDFNGAGSVSGTAGSLQHVEKVKVTPGETCKVVVGKGGKGGAVGEKGETGHDSYIECSGFKLISAAVGCSGEEVGVAQTEDSEAIQGRISGCGFTSPQYGCAYLTNNTCKYFDYSYATDADFDFIKTSAGSGKHSGSALANGNATGGNSTTATLLDVVVCGGMNSTCGNSSPDGQTYTFQAPRLIDIKHNFYGYAGGGGGGGGWDKSTNTAGKGGDGQDGYVFVWWGQ